MITSPEFPRLRAGRLDSALCLASIVWRILPARRVKLDFRPAAPRNSEVSAHPSI